MVLLRTMSARWGSSAETVRSFLARCSIRVVMSSPLRFVAKTIAFALSASLIHVAESLTSPTNRRHPLWCNCDAANVSLALTRHHTSWPALLNASAMALPMYPVAPNTSTRNFVILLSSSSLSVGFDVMCFVLWSECKGESGGMMEKVEESCVVVALTCRIVKHTSTIQ